MTDVHSKNIRSKNMAAIKDKDTKPELLVAELLRSKKLKFHMHDKTLPGKPDFVLPEFRAVIFVHGCFWHGHADCMYFKLPDTNKEFLKNKIYTNKIRDEGNIIALKKDGWWVLEIWECALRGKQRLEFNVVSEHIERWVLYIMKSGSIRGNKID